jgi:hypothetical protein
LIVAFFIGVGFVVILAIRYSQPTTKNEGDEVVKNPIIEETKENSKAQKFVVESPEAKAVRIAEDFIVQNGYTDLPADKNKITYETVEFAQNLEELLKERANTLERKAYGILYKGSGTKMGKKGWTIVFQYKNLSEDYYKSLSKAFNKKITKENYPLGRAVTMDENYQNLIVEHKDFPLQNVDKKL